MLKAEPFNIWTTIACSIFTNFVKVCFGLGTHNKLLAQQSMLHNDNASVIHLIQ